VKQILVLDSDELNRDPAVVRVRSGRPSYNGRVNQGRQNQHRFSNGSMNNGFQQNRNGGGRLFHNQMGFHNPNFGNGMPDFSESRRMSNRSSSFSSSTGANGYHKRQPWSAQDSQFQMHEGVFPQRNPGVKPLNELGDYDFDKGFEELSRLTLNESKEDTAAAEEKTDEAEGSSKPVTAYNKDQSFFDNLKVDSAQAESRPVVSVRSHGPKHQGRPQNPNIETFGVDTVRQLQKYRRWKPSGQLGGPHSYGGGSRGGYQGNNSRYSSNGPNRYHRGGSSASSYQHRYSSGHMRSLNLF